MDQNTNDKIKNELKQNEVCLFMKGTPEVPQCGFSLAVSNMLKHLEVKFKYFEKRYFFKIFLSYNIINFVFYLIFPS